MAKHNVLFLAEELRVGGAETYFYTLENTVDRELFNFFSMAVDGEGHKKLKYPDMFSSYSFSFINRYIKTLELCYSKKVDVIHVNSLRLAFVAAAVKKKKPVKIIYTKHNVTTLEKISKKLYAFFLNKHIDVVNAICHVEEEYLKSIGVKPQSIKVIFNGINLKNFPFKGQIDNNGIVNIGILARIDKVKNHGLFLEIAEKLHSLYDNTRFYIGGDGPDKVNIEQLIDKKDMRGYVNMSGYVKANEFLSKMNYTVLVSQREVFPISIIEAMASGSIVVAKDVGGICELVDESTGYIIKGENVSDYCNAFTKSFESDHEKEKIEAARSKVDKLFTLDIMLGEIEHLYRQCAK